MGFSKPIIKTSANFKETEKWLELLIYIIIVYSSVLNKHFFSGVEFFSKSESMHSFNIQGGFFVYTIQYLVMVL